MPNAARLSVLDELFWHLETENAHMHLGAVALFEGPAPTLEEVADEFAHRLERAPRFRQKLAAVPLGLARPVWVDDQSFEIERHLRHAALPRPGDRRRLNHFVARTISEPLDLTGPPWELHLVEGLAGGCFALVSKTHHCMLDGVAGADAMTAFLDSEPAPAARPHAHWEPSPAPTPDELVADAVREQLTRAAGLIGELQSLAGAPQEAADRTLDAIRSAGDFVASSFAAPSTTLNRAVGPQRRFETVPASLHDLRAVRKRFGTSLNDVVLAVVAGGLRVLLTERGEELKELRALAPVSLRTSEDATLGNRISSVWAPLPIDEPDPRARLRIVAAEMAKLKGSRRAQGAELLLTAGRWAPSALIAQVARLTAFQRAFNLVVTNVQGPTEPLYALGRQMLEVYPIVPLNHNTSVGAGLFTYNGTAGFGLVGDLDGAHDLALFAEGIEKSLGQLLDAPCG